MGDRDVGKAKAEDTPPVSTSVASELWGWGPPGSGGPLRGTQVTPSFLTSQERRGTAT